MRDRLPLARLEADVVQERVVERADEVTALAEGEGIAHRRPRHGRDRDPRDAHHEGVERVLRADEARVEEPEGRGHEQDERGGDEHPRGIARVDLGHLCDEHAAHLATGVTAPLSVSPVRMRTACSSGQDEDLAVADLAGLRRLSEARRPRARRSRRRPRSRIAPSPRGPSSRWCRGRSRRARARRRVPGHGSWRLPVTSAL